MKFKLFLLIAFFLIASCNTNKKYSYIEILSGDSLLGKTEKDVEIIQAKTDSIAYLKAYQKFCISEKVVKDMNENLSSSLPIPIDFKLMDSRGNDIAYLISFDKMDSLKKNIQIRVSETSGVKESIERSRKNEVDNFKKTVKIDSLKVEELDKYFIHKKDEFDPKGNEWVKPKFAPKYTNQNGLYCYFQVNDGMPSNLRFRLQYESDDWLFIRKVQFSIDGKAYEYVPRRTETDSGNGGRIWEWFDEPCKSSDRELLNALANGKTAKMKLIGRQYYDIKTVTSQQKRDIKRSLDLFKAMGGEL